MYFHMLMSIAMTVHFLFIISLLTASEYLLEYFINTILKIYISKLSRLTIKALHIIKYVIAQKTKVPIVVYTSSKTHDLPMLFAMKIHVIIMYKTYENF